jgi:hypothetical protein
VYLPKAHDGAEMQFRHAQDARLHAFSKIMLYIMVRSSQKVYHDFSRSMKLVLYFFELKKFYRFLILNQISIFKCIFTEKTTLGYFLKLFLQLYFFDKF